MGKITLGSFVFPDSASSGWWFSGLKDWMTLTGSKSEITARPVAHGSFEPGMDWRDSASVSFTAHYAGESAAESEQAARGITSLASADGLIRMSVEMDSGVLSRDVSIRNIDIPDHHGGALVTALVYCVAPDPFAYAATQTGSTGLPYPGAGVTDPLLDPFQEVGGGNPGRVLFINTGTAPTALRIDVAGGLSGGVEVRHVETGDTLRLERLIPDGSVITFDSRNGRAFIDGQSDVTGFMTVDNWWQVQPGKTCTVQFTPLGTITGTPTMTVTGSPAYF